MSTRIPIYAVDRDTVSGAPGDGTRPCIGVAITDDNRARLRDFLDATDDEFAALEALPDPEPLTPELEERLVRAALRALGRAE